MPDPKECPKEKSVCASRGGRGNKNKVNLVKVFEASSVEARINQRGAVKGAPRAVVGIFPTEHL